MINITKEKGYVVITSDDEKTFLIGEGILSVPCNTIEYTLDDESDFIQFNSIYEDGILFVGTIGNIQVNGTLVTRDNIIEQLDSVFNESYEGGGGSSSAGVNSINGYQGDVNIKTINSESLIGEGNISLSYVNHLGVDYTDNTMLFVSYNSGYGEYIKSKTINGESIFGSGDITIEGGSASAGVTAINIGRSIDSDFQKTGIVPFSTSWYDGSYDVEIGGITFYGLKPIDNSIKIESVGGTANGNERCGIKVNEWVGTQSEYDSLGTYDSGCTYYITE